MKYISVFLIVIALGLNAQESPVFYLGEVSTTASTVILPLTAAGFTNIASGNLKILYDPSVAIPVSVTKGTGLTGTYDYNLSDTGIVRIGWFTYPAMTLTDGAVIFNIEFKKAGAGTSAVSFDGTVSDIDCQFYNGFHKRLNDDPFDKYYFSGSVTFIEYAAPVTSAPELTATLNENIKIPVTVSGFKNVGAVSLVLEYDPLVLEYTSAENTVGFPELVVGNPSPGTITVKGIFNEKEGYSLPDGAVFFSVNCAYSGGTTGLIWNDDGRSCEYAGPQSAYVLHDTPQEQYYINGSIGPCQAPEAPVLLLKQPACDRVTGSVEITSPLGTDFTYSIDGTGYQASPSFTGLISGSYPVTVRNGTGCTSPVTLAVINEQPPVPVAPQADVMQPSCGVSYGTIEVTFPLGTEYSYSIDGICYQSSPRFSNVDSGNYSITAKNDKGCISAATAVLIKETPLVPVPPVPEITAATCDAAGNAFIVNFTADYTYILSPAGPVVDADGKITGIIAGIAYSITAVSLEGCESEASESFVAEGILEAPEPVIEIHRPDESCKEGCTILVASEAKSYLWSTGETDRSIRVTSSGEYFVEVTYQNGCSARSEPVSVMVTPAHATEAAKNNIEIKVYPNPFTEQLNIEFIAPETALACLEIFDMEGRLIKTLLNDHIEKGMEYRLKFTPERTLCSVFLHQLTIGTNRYIGIAVCNNN